MMMSTTPAPTPTQVIISEAAEGLDSVSSSEPSGIIGGVRAKLLKNSTCHAERLQIDPRLVPLVPDRKQKICGEMRSIKEIAGAIPNLEAFFEAVGLRKDPKFFKIDADGRLFIIDGCREAYGQGENFFEAAMRQSCIWYRDEHGQVRSLQREALYVINERTAEGGAVKALELTDFAKSVIPIMTSRLLRASLGEKGELTGELTGEYPTINEGLMDASSRTWVLDDSSDHLALIGGFSIEWEELNICKSSPDHCSENLGSRGLLEVNLDFTPFLVDNGALCDESD